MSQSSPHAHLLPSQPKASVLGVGTELTSGQILNKNGTWISQKLKQFGIQTSSHLVVPDDRQLILKSLDFCAQESDLIFVTGGLGPTSDDFTRDLISQWAEQKMVFHDPSWKKVIDRLSSRGFAVQEFQKQQCYFPEGAWILDNQQGTANGFYTYAKGKHFFILPGPPREIESIWNDHLHSWIQKNTSHIDALIVKSWDTLGAGESEIARRVEEVLPKNSFEIGYRVHLPYVEVKLSYYKSQQDLAHPIIQSISKALQPLTISEEAADMAEVLCKKLLKYEKVFIFDEATKGYLLHRLQPHWKDMMQSCELHFATNLQGLKSIKMSDLQKSFVVLQLSSMEQHEAELGLLTSLKDMAPNAGFKKRLSTPYKTQNMIERSQQFIAELALLEWARLI